MADNAEERENFILRNIEPKELSLVDNPAINEGWIVLKRDTSKDKELELDMSDEKVKESQEDVVKMSIKEAATKAASILEGATGGEAKDEQRLKLLIGNLKSLGGVAKTEDEEESVNKLDAAIARMEVPDSDVEKSGKKVSKETAATLSEVAMALKKSVKSIDSILKGVTVSTPATNKDESVEKKEYEVVANVDVESQLSDILKAYKEGLLSDEEVGSVLTSFSE